MLCGRSFLRSLSELWGAATARKELAVDSTFSCAPFFHRAADALETNMVAWLDPTGIVATKRALRGISVCVD